MTSTSTSASPASSTAKTSGGKPKKKKKGLYANIQAKRRRIAAGSGETMRKPHSEGAPTDESFRKSAKTAKPARKPKTTRHHRGRRAKARTGRSRSRSR